MGPGRTIEKKGDTGVQNKDEKTAQGGSMTRQQAEQEMEQLRKVFPSVRMLTAEQVQAGEAVEMLPGRRWKKRPPTAGWSTAGRSCTR